MDNCGADALRLYLINSPFVRAEPLRFQDVLFFFPPCPKEARNHSTFPIGWRPRRSKGHLHSLVRTCQLHASYSNLWELFSPLLLLLFSAGMVCTRSSSVSAGVTSKISGSASLPTHSSTSTRTTSWTSGSCPRSRLSSRYVAGTAITPLFFTHSWFDPCCN